MQLTLLKGYPDFVGRRSVFAGYGNGPASYNHTNGDPIAIPWPNWYIDAVGSGVSVSGTYYVEGRPSGVGARQKWALQWFLTAGGPVTDGTNLAGEQVQFGGNCGQY